MIKNYLDKEYLLFILNNCIYIYSIYNTSTRILKVSILKESMMVFYLTLI